MHSFCTSFREDPVHIYNMYTFSSPSLLIPTSGSSVGLILLFLLIVGHIFLLIHTPIIFKLYAGHFGCYVEKTQYFIVFLSRMLCFVLAGS